MSPQFVDFNADGHLDIVAGIFDGSPHVALGSANGYIQPVQILDQEGQRIVLNQFWNFETKKWDATTRCDPPTGELPKGQCTSAFAWDLDADGDLDLLLGDYTGGVLYLRRNEGTATAAKFATRNEPVLAGGKPLMVPHKMATPRVLDFDRDGLQDLVIGSMGDAYGAGEGGAVYLFRNAGENGAPQFGEPTVLVVPSTKGHVDGPVRPDAGLYMDVADFEGDGDLDLVVGGYSMWQPKAPELTDAQKARVKELRAAIDETSKAMSAIYQAIQKAVEGLDEEAASTRRKELMAAKQDELAAIGKRNKELRTELEPMSADQKRESFVWLYENKAQAPAAPVRRP
ncbi:MAG: VCBS repeat-containing protein [Planctomycetes bacterium]|nr:VCBS repeat-containing protein [Planctomycetota bacterium]